MMTTTARPTDTTEHAPVFNTQSLLSSPVSRLAQAEQDRESHLYANKIPSITWMSHFAFDESMTLLEKLLPLMQATDGMLQREIEAETFWSSYFSTIEAEADARPTEASNRVRRCAWLAIAYCHPDLSYELLSKAAEQLGLSEAGLLQAAAMLTLPNFDGGPSYFTRLASVLQQRRTLRWAIEAEDCAVLHIIAEQGRVDLLPSVLVVFDRFPHQAVHEMLCTAVQWGQVNMTCQLLQDAEKAGVDVFDLLHGPNKDFAALEVAATWNRIEIMKLFLTRIIRSQESVEIVRQIVSKKECEIIYRSAVWGYTGMLQCLEGAVSNDAVFSEMLTARQGAAFVMAVAGGYNQTVSYILEYIRLHAPLKLPRLLEAGDLMCHNKRYAAFIGAACYKHFYLLDYLLQYVAENAPNQFFAAKKAALDAAFSVNDPEVASVVGRIIAKFSVQQSSTVFGLWARGREQIGGQQTSQAATQYNDADVHSLHSQGPIVRRRGFQA
jgi:hypothetical protein